MLKNNAFNACRRLYRLLGESQRAGFLRCLEAGVLPAGESDARLFRAAVASLTGRQTAEPNFKKIHEACFPGRPFSRSRLDRLFRKLLGALRQYLAFLEFSGDVLLQQELLVRYLASREDYELFRRSARRWEKAVRGRPTLDAGFYQAMAEVHRAVWSHPDTPRMQPQLAGDRGFEENLDLSYALRKLAIIAEQRNRSRILQVEWDPASLEEIRPLVSRLQETARNPLLSLYLGLIELHAPNPDPACFERVKCTFYLNGHLCGEQERFSIFANLINYTNAAFRRGAPGALRDQLWLYKTAARFGWLLVDGRITDTAFQNAVVVAAHLRDFEFSSWFIAHFEAFLPASEKAFAVNFARANHFFYQGRFADALASLRMIHTANPLKGMMKTGFEIKCLYELALQENAYANVLRQKLRNFHRQLGRERVVANSHRVGYRNLVKILRQVNRKRLNTRVTAREKDRLREKISSLTPLKAKRWLLEKVEGL